MISTTESAGQSLNIANARTYATSRGAGYQLFDWMMWKLWQDLIIIFKETVDTNSGTAWTYDEMGIYWTTSQGLMDGACHNSGAITVSYKPSKFANGATASTDGYKAISYSLASSNGEIEKLGYDENNPFVNLPSSVVTNSSWNTYYCDGCYSSSGSRPIYTYVGDGVKPRGAFYCLASAGWTTAYAARLCYRPISS